MWKEMGRKMLYTSEVYNEDSPYWIDLPWEKDLPEEEKEGLLMVPYNYDCKSQAVRFFNCTTFLTLERQRREVSHAPWVCQ